MSDGPIIHVVGARPQFVKAAAVFGALREPARHRLLHTGQHYDAALSDVFFEELGLRAPDIHLGVGSGTHGRQTADMLTGIEAALLDHPRGRLVIYGDTNSTVAGALAAAKLHWPVFHVEAGLRSHDRTMPEEINRVVADHLSDVLLCPTEAAVTQLEREGLSERAVMTGDVMLDVFRAQAARARVETDAGAWLAGKGGRPALLARAPTVEPGEYALATIHRASNTDDAAVLGPLVRALGEIGRPVLWPVHPRAAAALERAGIRPPATVHCVEPVGYLTFVALLHGAALVLTDSGGVQREAFFAGRRCVTLRDTSEWPETTHDGWNIVAGTTPEAVVAAARAPTPTRPARVEQFGDGRAAHHIAARVEA